jgi:hypothetical protein
MIILYNADPEVKVSNLFCKVAQCELSNRLKKCLTKKGLLYIGDVIQKSEGQLLAIRNFGCKCLNEIKEYLAELDLELGTIIPDWQTLPPGQLLERLRQPKDLHEPSPPPLTEPDSKTCVKLLLPVKELDLSVRAANCLDALKIRYIGDLVQKKPRELLKAPNFGRGSLAEIERKLDELDLRLGVRLSEWTPEVIRQRKNLFGRELKKLRDARAEKFRQSLYGSADTLETELSLLATFAGSERNSRIVTKYFGWNGDGTTTLEAVGVEFGVTRERVRQILARFEKKLGWRINRKVLATPILDQALQFIVEVAPCHVEKIETGLVAKGITGKPFRLDGLLRTTELLRLKFPYNLVRLGRQRFVMLPEDRRATAAIVRYSRRIVGKQGVATVSDVVAQAEEEIGRRISADFGIAVLSSLPDFTWLDETSGWFWRSALPSGRNRLINNIEKILSVTNSIDISELRAGVSRSYRTEGFAPPRRVLLEFCRRLSWCRVERNAVIADPPLDWEKVLAGANEWAICAVLKEHSPVLRTNELEKLCLELGMNEHSFNLFLAYSPIITKYAIGVYGLRGARIPPGLIESLTTVRTVGKLIMDYGWTSDGRIWLGISLSEAILRTGIFGIPAAMKRFIEGDFVLKSADGLTIGNLKIKDSGGWSLKPFFRRRGGEPGDCLVLTFHPSSREAVAYLGDEDLLEDFRPQL